jgi:hypothetical protein
MSMFCSMVQVVHHRAVPDRYHPQPSMCVNVAVSRPGICGGPHALPCIIHARMLFLGRLHVRLFSEYSARSIDLLALHNGTDIGSKYTREPRTIKGDKVDKRRTCMWSPFIQ